MRFERYSEKYIHRQLEKMSIGSTLNHQQTNEYQIHISGRIDLT